MDIRQVRAVVTIVEHGTVSAAARELNYSQSGVVRQLQGLESELGIPLFVRAGNRLVPSPAVASVLPLLHSMVALSDAMTTSLRAGRAETRQQRRTPGSARSVKGV